MSTITHTPGTDRGAASQRTVAKMAIVLVLAGVAAYSNTFTKPFQLDDFYWIVNTEMIKHPEEYIRALPARAFVMATLALDYRVHGLDVFGYHLVNLAIHIAAALALFGLVRRTLLLPRWEGQFADSASWLAFAVAFLWMVHPLQTQAVTYIIQRCESMMGLFFLLTVYCLVRGTQSARAWPWYVASWGCCAIGAGSKEVMITVLPIMLAYDRVFVASWKEMLRRRWFFYIAIAAIWWMPLMILLPMLTSAEASPSFGFNMPGLPPHVYWMTQAWVVLHYLQLTVVPYPQSFNYRGWPPTTDIADFWPAGVALGIMLLGIGWLLWRRHWIGFVGLWFFGILSVTSIVPLVDVAFEHRMYLPLAALCTLMVIGGDWLCRKISIPRGRVAVGVSLTLLFGSTWTVMTLIRNNDYRSAAHLWQSVHELYPTNADALNQIAAGYEREGKPEEALEYHKKCLEKGPEIFQSQIGYGLLLCRNDQAAEGLKHLLTGAARAERFPSFAEWTGVYHYEIGKAYYIQNDAKFAEMHFRKAIKLAPRIGGHHAALALVLHEQHREDEARANFEQSLQLDAHWPTRANQMADNLMHQYPIQTRWTRSEAIFYAKQAVEATKGADPSMLDTLAEAYATNGNYAAAIEVCKAMRQLAAANSLADRDQRLRIAYYEDRARQEKKKQTP